MRIEDFHQMPKGTALVYSPKGDKNKVVNFKYITMLKAGYRICVTFLSGGQERFKYFYPDAEGEIKELTKFA